MSNILLPPGAGISLSRRRFVKGLATAINGSVPAPVLRWREGDTVTLSVSNKMAEDSGLQERYLWLLW